VEPRHRPGWAEKIVHTRLELGHSYERAKRAYRWCIPEQYNIATDVCDRWAEDPSRVALIHKTLNGTIRTYRFRDIQKQANRLANTLEHWGVERGDRVAIALPQSPEAAVSHMAIYKIGAIAVPCAVVLGSKALQFRLSHCDVRVLITDRDGAAKLVSVVEDLPEDMVITVIDAPLEKTRDYHKALAKASDSYSTIKSAATDPAFMIYSSGTTGEPKGILHAHQALIGHLPGVEMTHNFLPDEHDLAWTPSDWAWIGGLGDILLPFWHHGLPVLAWRPTEFDPEQALRTIPELQLRNIFVTPTALRLMQQVSPGSIASIPRLRSVGCGGEPLTDDLVEWSKSTFGTEINDSYGLTECNQVIVNSMAMPPQKRGSIGRAVPGHEIAIIDEDGVELPPGESGIIGIRRPDPVMFLRYWSDPKMTEQSFLGDWFLTGDLGRREESGFIFYEGRSDDLIVSSGYRVDPVEIETCMRSHPSISMVSVFGDPDEIRTQKIRAVVVLENGVSPSSSLTDTIQTYVKERLGTHVFPKVIKFADALPVTYSGKVRRVELHDA